MKVLIIDNYDSFVYNLVQYVGELGGRPIVFRNNRLTLKKAWEIDPDRIIISPGPGAPDNPKYFGVCSSLLQHMSHKVPTLGVCLGHQGIFYTFGGRISHAKRLMHGKTSLIKHCGQGIFKNVKNPLLATRYHSLTGDRSSTPPCLRITAESLDDNEIMGIQHTLYPIHGVQFHPESILTEDGRKIIDNFLEGV